MVGCVDIGDPHGELGGEAVLVFRKLKVEARHEVLGRRMKAGILALRHLPGQARERY